jgi:hypothetical protein
MDERDVQGSTDRNPRVAARFATMSSSQLLPERATAHSLVVASVIPS